MKRMICFILCLSVSIGLGACSNAGGKETDIRGEQPVIEKEQLVTQIENKGKKPSDSLILDDLQEALILKNEHATLTGTETVKSLTDDNKFVVTLSVIAETKYADWTYEIDLSYTRYDQGWMLDSAEWNEGEYSVVRKPDNDTLAEQINVAIEKTGYKYLMEMLPVENGEIVSIEDTLITEPYYPYVDELSELAANNEILLYRYTKNVPKLHAISSEHYYVLSEYNADEDNWLLVSDNKYVDIPCFDRVADDYSIAWWYTISCSSDFSGTWADSTGKTDEKYVISNFTGESFDKEFGTYVDKEIGDADDTNHFVRLEGDVDDSRIIRYSNGISTFDFIFYEDKTTFCQHGQDPNKNNLFHFGHEVTITDPLPPLN